MNADMTVQRLIVIAVCALAALALAGCGVRGGLERPAPLWGAPGPDAPEAAPAEDEDEDEDFLDPDDWRSPG